MNIKKDTMSQLEASIATLSSDQQKALELEITRVIQQILLEQTSQSLSTGNEIEENNSQNQQKNAQNQVKNGRTHFYTFYN